MRMSPTNDETAPRRNFEVKAREEITWNCDSPQARACGCPLRQCGELLVTVGSRRLAMQSFRLMPSCNEEVRAMFPKTLGENNNADVNRAASTVNGFIRDVFVELCARKCENMVSLFHMFS